ncbi:response regulator transcription factor [Bradyrhizobium sp. AZCC 2289]|uniref:response regulator transcription factor n=1 Tax=Bradyrhizobium sp. AZCC 2289 TaxID=3117026 RepID=UPI002FF15F72
MTKAPTIAIIDDDETIRTGLHYLVTSLGYDVYTFGSAPDFLQSEQLHAASCVISDVRMPFMSGIQLQAHLRSTGYKVPFIFITAIPEESIRRQAFNDGAIGFLNKPLDDEALIACLQKALRRPSV